MKKSITIVSSALVGFAALMPAGAQTVSKLSAARHNNKDVASRVAAKPWKKPTVPAKSKSTLANALASGLGVAFTGTPVLTDLSRQNIRSYASATAEMPDLYGCVTYQNKAGFTPGFFKITESGTTQVFSGPTANYGALVSDNIIYTFDYPSFGGFYWIQIDAWDLETGEQLASNQFGEITNLCPGGAVQDPTSGKIYAITLNTAGNGYWLSTLDIDSEANVNTNRITALNGNWNSLVCDATGQLYGISYTTEGTGTDAIATSSTLCKLDKQTGAVTQIGETGESPQYMSSAAIDLASGRMFWNVNPLDGSSWMCEVDLQTGAATRLFELPLGDAIMGLFVQAPPAEATAPAAVTDLEASFPDGALSGTINFTAPETLFDGTAASGPLSYRVMVDGAVVAQGETKFGEKVSAEVSVDAAGQYIFMVYVSNEAGDSPVAKTELFIGNGVPKMTVPYLSYENGTMLLTWDPVTESIDGGYVNAEAVTYSVIRYPGGKTVASNLKDTKFSEEIAAGEGLETYYYAVKAAFAGLNSDPVTSNPVTLGSVVPPYSNSFNVPEDLQTFNIIDANGDGYSWTIEGGRAQMIYNKTENMDDWMITPGLKLEGGKIYYVSFEASSNSTAFPERVEAKWGAESSVAGMTEDLVEPTLLDSRDYKMLGAYMAPETDGVYYVGIHGISDPDMYYLYVRNFSVGAAQTAGTPGAVTDLKVVPASDGELEATVSFTVPKVGITGLPITSVTKVSVMRGDKVVKVFDASETKVGTKLEYTDVVPVGGTYEYSVQASNAEGDGPIASESVFIGVGKPAAPADVKLTEEGNSGRVTISWQPVDKDEEGAPINPAKVKYVVYKHNGQDWEAFTEELTETSYTLQAVPVGQQGFVQYVVFAVTDGGQTGTVSEYRPVGKPYASVNETFAEGKTHYLWGVSFIDGGTWEISKDEDFGNIQAPDGDGGFATFSGETVGATAAMLSGKVNLAGMKNPGFSFRTYNIVSDTPDNNEIALYIREASSQDWVELRDVIVVNDLNPGQAGWQNVIVSLADYAGKTIEVRIQPTVKVYTFVLIDGIRIDSHEEMDLAAKSISAPAFVPVGTSFDLYVNLVNNGLKDMTNFSVELQADGVVADTRKVESLASGETLTVKFECTMNVLAVEPVEYRAVLKADEDGDLTNNSTEAIYVEPKLSRLPAVDDLAAEVDDKGVMLTWSEPDLTKAPAETTEYDFEDGNSFALEYDDWTFVDVDKSPIGGFSETDIPGLTPGESTASFFVFDNSGDEFSVGFDTHSGNMCLASMFRYDDGEVDDWAISPELSGSAQTISFYARSYHSQYSETIELYYSMDSTDPEMFVRVGDPIEKLPRTWERYEFDVPQGAKYFAIRSCATAGFMLMLDDFTFEKAGSKPMDLSIVGYDVYRNGVKLTAEPTAECEYFDTTAVEGEAYTYVVVTVYEEGVSGASNSVSTTDDGVGSISGKIKVWSGKGTLSVSGAEGKLVTVSAIDGRIVSRGVASTVENYSVPAGVYIVSVDKKTRKIIVR